VGFIFSITFLTSRSEYFSNIASRSIDLVCADDRMDEKSTDGGGKRRKLDVPDVDTDSFPKSRDIRIVPSSR